MNRKFQASPGRAAKREKQQVEQHLLALVRQFIRYVTAQPEAEREGPKVVSMYVQLEAEWKHYARRPWKYVTVQLDGFDKAVESNIKKNLPNVQNVRPDNPGKV